MFPSSPPACFLGSVNSWRPSLGRILGISSVRSANFNVVLIDDMVDRGWDSLIIFLSEEMLRLKSLSILHFGDDLRGKTWGKIDPFPRSGLDRLQCSEQSCRRALNGP